MQNTFEGGTNGTNLSVANSGGINGTAVDSVVINGASANGGGSGIQYSSAAALQGALGLLFTLAASTTYIRFPNSTTGARGGLRRAYKHVANPTASAVIASIRCEGGGPLSDTAEASMVDLLIDTSGRVCLQHPSPTGIDTASRYTLTAGTQYWFEVFVEKGTTTSNGKAWLRVLAADGTTVLWDYTNAAVNTRSSNVYQFRVGGATTASGWATDSTDSVQFGNLVSGFFGPLTELPKVDTVSITTTGEPFSTATVTATLEPGSPTPDSWTFTKTAGPAVTFIGTGATRTFLIPAVMPPGSTITVQATAVKGSDTDSKSASASILPCSQWLRLHGGSWLGVRHN